MPRQKGKGKPVYIIAAARTDSVKYVAENYRSLSDLLAEPVRQIGGHLLRKVDTVFVAHRYPTPFGLHFDREDFLKQTELAQGESLRFLIDNRALLGGMEVIQFAISILSEANSSTILVVGGEVFEPKVWKLLNPKANSDSKTDVELKDTQDREDFMHLFDLQERRHLLNKFGGLAPKDRKVGLTPLSANALVADAFFRDSRLTQREMTELMCCISSHLEKYAFMNPYSYQHHKPFDEYHEKMSRITADIYGIWENRSRKWPFTLLDMCGISNGAGAVLLTNDVDQLEHKVIVAGCAISKEQANKSLLDRPTMSRFEANRLAWKELRKLLGKEYPFPGLPEPGAAPIQILELFDIYGFQIAMTLCEMGLFSNIHDILRAFQDRYFDPAPDIIRAKHFKDISTKCGIILNPSGGSKDGHPNGGFAVIKAAECFFQLTDLEREGTLVLPREKLDYAFVHSLSGAGNTAGILALKKVN